MTRDEFEARLDGALRRVALDTLPSGAADVFEGHSTDAVLRATATDLTEIVLDALDPVGALAGHARDCAAGGGPHPVFDVVFDRYPECSCDRPLIVRLHGLEEAR